MSQESQDLYKYIKRYRNLLSDDLTLDASSVEFILELADLTEDELAELDALHAPAPAENTTDAG